MNIQAILHQASLPPDAILTELSFRSGLSELFKATVTIFCEEPNLALEDLVWQELLIELVDPDTVEQHGPSFVHGVIERAEYVSDTRHGHLYELLLRPQVHGLAYRVRSRIFQDLSVPDVVRAVLSDAGIPDIRVEWHTNDANYVVRDYITQWKESELDFVRRLLEDEGIFFWFEHATDGHRIHFADDPSVHQPVPGDPILMVSARGQDDPRTRDIVFDVLFEARAVPDVFAMRDWNYMTPDLPPEAREVEGDEAGREQYLFPGRFEDSSDASRKAQRRLAASLCQRYRLTATTPLVRVRPGALAQIDGSAQEEIVGEYLVLGTTLRYRRAQGSSAAREAFVELEATPSAFAFHPPQVTPRPRATGKESAVVTGPTGEEISVDHLGRITALFYWDREGPNDETSSRQIRTQQLNTSGTMVLPRMGWEISVGFLHGDPDQPVMFQKLYNDETMPPYDLPGQLATSTLQSATTPGGGGTNEVRMCDTNGSQELFVHAQKDMAMMVGNDLTEEVAVDAKAQVGSDAVASVTGDESVSVGGDQNLSVTGMCTDETVGSRTVTVGGLDDWGVTGIQSINVDGSRSETVGGLMSVLCNIASETFNASHTRDVGGAQLIVTGKAIADAVGGNKTETVGGAKICVIKGSMSENIGAAKALTAGLVSIKTGGDVTVSADGALGYAVGGPMAVKAGGDFAITGSTITFNVGNASLKGSSGQVTVSGGSIALKAGKVEADGGKVTLKGGSVKYVP